MTVEERAEAVVVTVAPRGTVQKQDVEVETADDGRGARSPLIDWLLLSRDGPFGGGI